MKKSKKAGLILTVGAALFLVAGAPALADETDTISKNVYIGGVNVSGMTEEQATKAVEEKLGKGTGGNYTVKIGDETPLPRRRISVWSGPTARWFMRPWK